jgi:hypothetical protein
MKGGNTSEKNNIVQRTNLPFNGQTTRKILETKKKKKTDTNTTQKNCNSQSAPNTRRAK